MPPSITVFKENEDLDEEATRAHIRFLLENGAHGICTTGTTGECAALSDEERRRVIEIIVDEVNGKAPVYAGTGHDSTRLTIELSRYAEDVGADGLLVISPYYRLPTEREIFAHFEKLSSAVNLPIMLYQNPWVTKVDIKPWQVAALFERGYISSVKEAHGDAGRVHDILSLTNGKCRVLYGHDVDAFEAFCVGAEGWIAGGNNLIPKQCRELYDLIVEKREIEKARALWYKLLPLIQLLSYTRTGERSNWQAMLKEGLEMRGRRAGRTRMPVLPLPDAERERLRSILGDLGLLAEG
ncbi:MAG: dihydrodipicolinate synthase family protein [Candidatus Bathyarchaeia archaeon]